ncbi:related to HSD1 - ER membrane protein [Melanopsichium pennsylvanicum]|uniref:Related to HSD1 - ER membrane protein n=2 Tax=Melanopsichium pennsylvanicum TaxID=63383 RepID=A0AAJ5C749_9BASI|nr:related to HSD1-ER membrane protein [Melanopsichium pennsylvanicum 4]SNX86551.1 related to HSD1 - ER membrane protein [Melanopsichium pennsylvanicum]
MSSRPSAKVLSESPRSSPPPLIGTTSQNGSTPPTGKNLTRQRSSSLQKGAAVLRALSRAESDLDRDMLERDSVLQTNLANLTAPVQGTAAVTEMPANGSSKVNASSDGSGLRQRSQAVKRPSSSSSSSPRTDGPVVPANKKSWEIPRKIFHSSIGFMVLHLYLSGTNLNAIVRSLSYFLGIVVTADVIRLNNDDFERLYERVLGFLMRESEKDKVNGVVWYLVGVIASLHFFPEDIACVSIMILSWCDTCASTFGRAFGRYTPPLPSPPFARRKSTAGFLAAIISGALTSYLFWCTSIASAGVRTNGISWSGSGYAHPAIFGTDRVPGAAGTGWESLSVGFRGQSGAGLLPRASGLSAQYLGADSIAKGKLGTDALPIYNDVPGMPWWLLTLGSGVIAGVAEGLELGGVDDNLSLPILSATGIWTFLYSWGRLATAWQRWFS